MRLLAYVMAALLAATLVTPPVPAAAHSRGTFRNPVALNAADPQISYVGGSYYLLRTEGDGISIIRSASITGLGSATPRRVWTGSADAPSRCCNIWAPELHRINGKWYVYYTADDGIIDHHNMHVIEADTDDPLGTYHYKGQVSSGKFAIDGTILQQPDGSLYLLYSKADNLDVNSIVIARLTNPWTAVEPPVEISRPTNPWETHIRPVNEGPYVLRHNGKLFVVFSVSACESPDYALAMLTYVGNDPLDPAAWRKSTPLFTRSDANWVFGPGHNSFFSSPDGTEVWNAYHAVTSSDGSVRGNCGGERSTRVQKVNWNADGTPNFGTPAASWQSLALPSGDPGAAPIRAGFYRLTPQNGKTNALQNCPSVNIGAYAGDRCQRWYVTPDGRGSYVIASATTGRPLAVKGCSTANGSTVDTHWGFGCQSWYVDAVGDGSVRISNRQTGLALDVAGCSAAPGSTVDVWPYWSTGTGTCQQWRLAAV